MRTAAREALIASMYMKRSDVEKILQVESLLSLPSTADLPRIVANLQDRVNRIERILQIDEDPH